MAVMTNTQGDWQRDSDAAYLQALSWVETVGQQRGWSAEWMEFGRGIVQQEKPGWYDFGPWETTAQAWWADLYTVWVDTGDELEAAGNPPPLGWLQLGTLFGSAAGASNTAELSDYEASLLGQLAGTAEETAADAQEVAERAAKTPWYVWAGLALGALALVRSR